MFEDVAINQFTMWHWLWDIAANCGFAGIHMALLWKTWLTCFTINPRISMKEIKVKESSIFKRVLSAKQDPGNLLIHIFSVSGMNVSSVSRIRIVQYLLRIRGNTGQGKF